MISSMQTYNIYLWWVLSWWVLLLVFEEFICDEYFSDECFLNKYYSQFLKNLPDESISILLRFWRITLDEYFLEYFQFLAQSSHLSQQQCSSNFICYFTFTFYSVYLLCISYLHVVSDFSVQLWKEKVSYVANTVCWKTEFLIVWLY